MIPRNLPAVAAAAVVALASATAAAQDTTDLSRLPMPSDNDYAIDIYEGAAFGSVEIVGMGGVAVATAQGSSGISSNPAAPAVRPSTSHDKWDWDFHADWLNNGLADDFDNNGVKLDQEANVLPFFTVGAVGRYKKWAIGLSFASVKASTGDETDPDLFIESETSSIRFAVARTFFDDVLTLGVGTRAGVFSLDQVDESGVASGDGRLFDISGASIEAGALWRPELLDLRVGGAISLPVTGTEVTVNCDDDPATPNVIDCQGFVLPNRASLPLRVSAGAAWRFAGSRWNRPVYQRWRDERYVTVAADLIVTGRTEDGHGIEAFTQKRLQPAGRDTSIGFRTGVEYEWVPGWLRIRGGIYYEPSRYRDHLGDDVPGRPHVTLGLDVRIWSFCLFSRRYRLKASLTSDGAEDYANGGVSIGFWH